MCLRSKLQKHGKYVPPSQFWGFGSETGLTHLPRGSQAGTLLLRYTSYSFPEATVSGTLMVIGEAPQSLPPATRSAPKLSGRFKNNAKTEVKLGSNPPYRAFRLNKFKSKPSHVSPRIIPIWPVVTLITYVSTKV